MCTRQYSLEAAVDVVEVVVGVYAVLLPAGGAVLAGAADLVQELYADQGASLSGGSLSHCDDAPYSFMPANMGQLDGSDVLAVWACCCAGARVQVALADSCVEDFDEDFVWAGFGHWVVLYELDFAAELADEGDCLSLGD